jgi:SAM-dependent methyltransferase
MGSYGRGPGVLHGRRVAALTHTPPTPSRYELESIRAMSRAQVVEAYGQWSSISEAESFCLSFLPSEPEVIDLGCGTGRMFACAGHRFASYLGVDRSTEMIERARSLHPTANFKVADVLDFVLPGRSGVDVVLIMHNVIDMLHPQDRRHALLRQSRALLKPGGTMICSSHLARRGDTDGYRMEDYHGSQVLTFRASLGHWVAEAETANFEVLHAVRDFRGSTADWAYVVTRRIG